MQGGEVGLELDLSDLLLGQLPTQALIQKLHTLLCCVEHLTAEQSLAVSDSLVLGEQIRMKKKKKKKRGRETI